MNVDANSIRNLPNRPPTDIELVMAFLTYYKIQHPAATECWRIRDIVDDWPYRRLADLADELDERGFETDWSYERISGVEYFVVKW